jgi:putative transposase
MRNKPSSRHQKQIHPIGILPASRVGWVERSDTHRCQTGLSGNNTHLIRFARIPLWLPIAATGFRAEAISSRSISPNRDSRLLIERVDLLRDAFRYTQARHPFTIDAIVVLPDHLHAIFALPEGDADYAPRMRLIKTVFSRNLPKDEHRSESRVAKGERGIWQRRYWEHTLRNDRDYAKHVDYIHFNPVKHGHVKKVQDWPYSSFQRFVRRGVYPHDWAMRLEEGEGLFGES